MVNKIFISNTKVTKFLRNFHFHSDYHAISGPRYKALIYNLSNKGASTNHHLTHKQRAVKVRPDHANLAWATISVLVTLSSMGVVMSHLLVWDWQQHGELGDCKASDWRWLSRHD